MYEQSRVVDIRPGLPTYLMLAQGRLRAQEVVLTTNAALASCSTLSPHITNFSSYAVLTAPAPDVVKRINWTGGEGFFDGRMFRHYFRTTPDGRVLMGTSAGPIGFQGRIDRRFTDDLAAARRAARALRRLLPALDDVEIVAAWGGVIDVSADNLPLIGTFGNSRIHYACGFSGHGVNPAWIAGQTLAALVMNERSDWTESVLCTRSRKVWPPEPFRYWGGRLVRAGVLACEDSDEAGRPPPVTARLVAYLPKLLGMRFGTR